MGRFLVSLLGLGLGLATVDDCQEDGNSCSAHLLQAGAERIRKDPISHPWPNFRGKIPGQQGVADEAPPHDLSNPVWTWKHPKGQFHTMLSGGPVIDKDLNLYQMSSQGIRKFSSQGKEAWIFEVPGGGSNNEVALYDNVLLGTSKTGMAYAVDRHTGKAKWTSKMADNVGGDCGYPAASDGVFVAGFLVGYSERQGYNGNRLAVGIDTSSGQKLWEYAPDNIVWNLSPLFPDDNSVVFMDYTGGMYKLGLHNGTLLWKTAAPKSGGSFSDGGATLGPNGKVYTCSNYGDAAGSEGTPGVVRAFDLASGAVVWEKLQATPCNSYPSVGHVAGIDKLVTVALTGAFIPVSNSEASVLALDAETGEEIYRYNLENVSTLGGAAAGDLAGLEDRLRDGIQPICLPAHWSAPTIDKKGNIYGIRMNGFLYVVKGPEKVVKDLPPSAVVDPLSGIAGQSFLIGSAGLHGAAAWAPGIFAISTCDSLYVFNT